MSCVQILPSLAVLKIFFVSLLLFPYPEPCITSYNVSCIQKISKSQLMKLSTRRILFFVANMLLTSSQFLCSIPCQPPLAPEVFVLAMDMLQQFTIPTDSRRKPASRASPVSALTIPAGIVQRVNIQWMFTDWNDVWINEPGTLDLYLPTEGVKERLLNFKILDSPFTGFAGPKPLQLAAD